MHGDLIHVPPFELHALTSPWPFLVWGIDIIRKISPKSSNGHEYILVAIDYFTKWVEGASHARLTAARVTKFNILHIICRYGLSHELIYNSDMLVICSSLVAYTLSLYVYIHEAFIILSCYLNCGLT